VELRGEAVLGRAAAASAVARFCKGIVDAVGPYVVAVKPQSAFFEALGADGARALEEVCDYARSTGLLVIVDAKRGDIGPTARAYASAFLEPRDGSDALADAVTASPFLGHDSCEPFIAACRRHGAGVFFLVRTSNAGATEIQDATLSDGRLLWQYVAELVHECGSRSSESTVSRALQRSSAPCHPRAVSQARKLMPQTLILLPESGRRERLRPTSPARSQDPASALVTASRSVIFAYRGTDEDWRTAAAAAAQRLAAQVWAAAGWK
jgi:orotidine-5'-phosphate decarboxylase